MEDDVLRGWNQIAAYLGMDLVDTLRMAKLDDMPVVVCGDQAAARKSGLEAWLRARRRPESEL